MKYEIQANLREDELYGGRVQPIRKDKKKSADDLFEPNKDRKRNKKNYSEERKVKRGEEMYE